MRLLSPGRSRCLPSPREGSERGSSAASRAGALETPAAPQPLPVSSAAPHGASRAAAPKLPAHEPAAPKLPVTSTVDAEEADADGCDHYGHSQILASGGLSDGASPFPVTERIYM